MSSMVAILIIVGMVIPLANPVAVTGQRSFSSGELQQAGALENASVAYVVSTNWAGYAYCPSGSSFGTVCRGGASLKGSFGCWTVPQVAQTISSGSAGGVQDLSIWTGIGGTAESSLAQIGVTVTPGQTVHAWWETLPSPATRVPLAIRPGDLVCAEVELVGQNPFGQQIIYFAFEDLTSGASWDNSWLPDVCGGAVFWPACERVQADSAEWVVESPMVNGQEASLPAFSEIDFQNIAVDLSGNRWVPASELEGAGQLTLLELQSSVAPTSPAFMTQVSSLSISADGVTGFSVSYLAKLSQTQVMTGRSSLDVTAVLVSSDTLTWADSPSSFSLALTATLIACDPQCQQSTVERSGISVMNGAQPVGSIPLGHGPNPEFRATACLWWVSPGSSLNQSGTNLLLECANESSASDPYTVISPMSYSPALTSLEFAMTIYGLLAGEVAALIGLVIQARRRLLRRGRSSPSQTM